MIPIKKRNAPEVSLRVKDSTTLHHPQGEVLIPLENQEAVHTGLRTREREEDTEEMSCKGSLGRLSLPFLKVIVRKGRMLKLGC